ncbi:MAG: glycosyltransferase family 2 protein [Sulfolobales archaeon]
MVPTYNEAENVGELLERIRRAMGGRGFSYEVVIVDDSSSDGTAEVARDTASRLGIPLKLIIRSSRGLAGAVMRGFREASGEYILVMDADLQHPPEVAAEMVERALREGLDIVIASRYVEGGGVEGWSIYRRIVSRLASIVARILIPQARRVRDPLSGFFLIRRSVIEAMEKSGVERHGRSFKILLEILVRGRYERIAEHPYIFKPRVRGRSKLGLRESLEFIKQVIELSDYRILKFMLVGSTGVIVNNLVLYALTSHMNVPVYIASPIAIETATVNNFILNDRWTFKRFRQMGRAYIRLAKYHIAVGLGNLVNYVVVLALHQILGIIPANILGIGLGFITNYLVSSEFVWEIAKSYKGSRLLRRGRDLYKVTQYNISRSNMKN